MPIQRTEQDFASLLLHHPTLAHTNSLSHHLRPPVSSTSPSYAERLTDRHIDEWIDERTDRQTGGETDGRKDGCTDRQTDGQAGRRAAPGWLACMRACGRAGRQAGGRTGRQADRIRVASELADELEEGCSEDGFKLVDALHGMVVDAAHLFLHFAHSDNMLRRLCVRLDEPSDL